MEIRLSVLIPVVSVLCFLLIVGISLLCRFYFTRVWKKKKHNYSKLDSPKSLKSQKSTIRPTTPPQFSFIQEQQSSRISDPPVFGSDSFKTQSSRDSDYEVSASSFKKFNPIDEDEEENDLFNYDDNRSFKSSGSEHETGSSHAESVHSDRYEGRPLRLSKHMKTRFKSEPILNTIHNTSHEKKWKRFSKHNRSKTKVISLTEPAAGQLEFTLFYDPDDRLFIVNIVQLLNIELKPESFIGILEVHNRGSDRDEIGESMHLIRNPDDTLELSGISETGFSIHLTLAPKKSFTKHTETKFSPGGAVFNEKFAIHGQTVDQLSQSYLSLHVLCKFGRDCEPMVLGEVKVPLKRLQIGQLLPFIANIAKPENEILLESSLKPVTDLGFLEVYLSYNPIAQTLVVRIIQGSGLPKIGMTGHPNISVKTSLYYCNLRTSKKTTSIQKRQRNPIFNETFEFQLSKERIAECDVLFEIRHHGPMSRSIIGYVIVGHSAGGEGSKQWKQLLDFSYHEQNYKILPYKPVGIN